MKHSCVGICRFIGTYMFQRDYSILTKFWWNPARVMMESCLSFQLTYLAPQQHWDPTASRICSSGAARPANCPRAGTSLSQRILKFLLFNPNQNETLFFNIEILCKMEFPFSPQLYSFLQTTGSLVSGGQTRLGETKIVPVKYKLFDSGKTNNFLRLEKVQSIDSYILSFVCAFALSFFRLVRKAEVSQCHKKPNSEVITQF